MCEYDDKTKIYHCLPMFYNAGMMNIFSEYLLGQMWLLDQGNQNLFKLVDILRDYKINSIHLTPEILIL